MKFSIVFAVILLNAIRTVGTAEETPAVDNTDLPNHASVSEEPTQENLFYRRARERQEERLEKKIKELRRKGIVVESASPKEIGELLASNVLTIADAENIFPEDKLMKVSALTVFRQMQSEDATVSTSSAVSSNTVSRFLKNS